MKRALDISRSSSCSQSRWWTAYKKAVSFRASHYFISYMSEATAVTAGIQSKEGDWNLEVAQPVNVEVPRSLKEVAKSWDRPKHDFLKYCEC